MTTIPKKIWLQREEGVHPDCDTYHGEGMTWCEDKINKDDIEYVRADLVSNRAGTGFRMTLKEVKDEKNRT